MVIRARLILLAAVAGLFVWVFADAIFGSGVFVFRDAGHYYYPLFQFVKSEWLAGRVPLWNPYENLGVPLAANATSSVFYPGALIFWLPVDYATAYTWYVMGHVLLAAWAAYRLARRWGATIEAAGAAALSYAFSGNVLFQYCNVIYLVGAAWLPLAVLAADRMLTHGSGFKVEGSGIGDRGPGSLRAAVALGVVLAMITLGGNAEMAYHAGLLAAMYALWLWWYERPQPAQDRPARGRVRRVATSRPALLALAAGVGLALAAVQVLPSIEFTRRSDRVATSVPRTIYDLPGYLLGHKHAAERPGGHWSDGLTCRRLEPGTHHEHVYHFSVGPWRLAEYLWPNLSGRQFPVHRRWLEVVPTEGRIWVPSFYMGLVPLVLAVASMRLCRADARHTWLTWMVILAVVASFGWYGFGWLAEQVRAATGADVSKPWLVDGPFGGLYWLATLLLPGYIEFRYPAKLLVIAALGLSMLAAVGWDRAFAAVPVRLRRGLLWLAGISLLGAAVALAVRPFWAGWLSGVAPDVLFGPLDTAGAYRDLLAALAQTAAVSIAFWWLLGSAGRGARWPAIAAVALVAVDLGVANRWMVACAPAEQWTQEPTLAAAIDHVEASRHSSAGKRGQSRFLSPHQGQPFRVYRQRLWTPPAWRLQSSPSRLVEAARWDHDTLWPKYNLAAGLALAEVQGTMAPYDYEVFVARRGPPPFATKTTPDPFSVDPFSVDPFFVSNVKYFILRGHQRLPGGVRLRTNEEAAGLEDVSVWYQPRHLPRAWIVHDVDVLDAPESLEPGEVRRRTDRVFFTHAGARDLLESALVEPGGGTEHPALSAADRTAAKQSGAKQSAAPALGEAESCSVTHYDPLCVQIEAQLTRPGLVVLCDQFYPGWRLQVETAGQPAREVPILRTNRVMRGAWLPAGVHRLTYRYRPVSFLAGAALSAIAWVGLALIVVGARFAGRRLKADR